MSPIAPTTNRAHVDESDLSPTTNKAPLALDVLTRLAADYVSSQLQELRGLSSGWDGGRAKAIPDETLEFAMRVFVAIFTPGDDVPAVVPTVKGGIQFEWHNSACDVEISVPRPGRVDVYTVNHATADDYLDSAAAPAEVAIVLHEHGARLS